MTNHVSQLRVRGINLIIHALTLVASLSWLNAIQKGIEYVVPKSNTSGYYRIVVFFGTAIFLTIVAISFSHVMEPYSKIDEHGTKKVSYVS